jgi:hypothetical protein
LENKLVRALSTSFVRFEGSKETINAEEEPVIYYTFVLKSGYMVFSLSALLMDLGLLCADEGSLVNVWVNFNIRVIAEL